MLFDDSKPREDKIRVTEPVLGGRASLMSNRRTTQLFGQLATDGTTPLVTFNGTAEIRSAGILESPRNQSQCQRLWRIRTAGVEVLRSSQAPVAPLTRSEITAGADDGLGQVNAYKLLIDVSSDTGFTSLRGDIGQTIDIVGFSINVSFIGPPDAVEVGSNPGAVVPQDGLVADAVVGYSLSMIEAPDCHCEWEYTQFVAIPAAAPLAIEVPRFARRVRAFMSLGTAAASWVKSLDGGPTPVFPVGPLDFDVAGIVSTTESEDLGGAASFITTDTDAADRFAVLIWTIRP